MRGLCCLVGIGRHCSSDIGLKYPLIDHLSLTLAFDLEWKIPWSLRGHLVNADPPISGSECSPGVIRIWFIFVRQAADGSKNSTQAVAACWAATAWFARGSCMQPARLCQRPTLVNTQGPIRLRHAFYVTVAGQRAAAASQPAGWCRSTACGRTDRPEASAGKVCAPICTHQWKNVIIFVTRTPIDITSST